MAKIPINISTGTFQKADIIIGIDLGTTNSLVAYINDDLLPEVINDMNRGVLVPSIVHFHPSGEVIVGEEAKQYLLTDPQNTVFSVKRLLGRSYRDIEGHKAFFSYKVIDDDTEGLVKIRVGDRFYTPIELSALILKELVKRAEHALKTPVTRAVITVPAYFNDSQRQATRDAGKLAGLDVLRIVNEPTAASLAYGIGLNPEEEKTVAVYDLGGGTFDISILRIQNGIFEVLSTNGDTFLGGDDLDRAIIDYWMDRYKIGKDKITADPEWAQTIRLRAEEAKKALSNTDNYHTEIAGVNYSLDRATFEKLIQPYLERTLECCRNAMHDAMLNTPAIDTVIMVGGSTRTPLVRQSVSDFFEKPVYDSLNPDEVVALGAAIQADILAGNRKDMLLLDVTPLSLGIETMGGLMDVIIPRNSKIPTKAGRQYTTSIDGQANMKIAVYQGERDLVAENRKLAEFDLKNIPAMPAGLPKVDINFLLNADGILTVQAVELRSGIRQEIEVKPTYGLTDAEVEKMLLDSIQNAREDVEKRMIIEARGEAEQILYNAEKFVRNHAGHLDPEELKQTTVLIEDLKSVLQSGNKNKILSAIDALNEYTRPFAERIMDIAVSKAMKGKKL